MPGWVYSSIVYGSVVLFWIIIFFVAVTLARRALHGVGEPLAVEKEDIQADSVNGHIPDAETASTGTAKSGGARG